MKQKILFSLAHPKRHYFKEENGEIIDNFFNTQEGKLLKETLREQMRLEGVEGNIEYHISYAFPNIPQILKDNARYPERVSYKKPTVSEFNTYKEAYLQKVTSYDPDIIIPLSGEAMKPLIGSSALAKFRGQPKEVSIGDNLRYWVLPTYSSAYVQVNPNAKVYMEQDFSKLARFLKEGSKAFEVTKRNYKVIPNDFNLVASLFKEAFQHGKTVDDPIAWDYETSSLKAEREGSKILTISMAWKGNIGVTIPINHWEQPWKPEEQEKVNALLKLFLGSKLWKVGHNVQFDERQSKFLIDKDLTFSNTMDTMVGYYLTVSQEERVSFGLKTVAYEFTEQGGYEQPLDDYKDWFLKYLIETEKATKGKREPITDEDYLPWLSSEDREVADKWVHELLEQYGEAKLVRNPADGEKFSYEWIPYDILARYAGGDVDVTLQIHHALLKRYLNNNPKLYKLYTEHYPALLDTLSDIEVFGIQLDRERMLEMKGAFEEEQARLMQLIKQDPYVLKVEEYKEEQYILGLQEKTKPVSERDSATYKLYTKYRLPEDRKFNPSSKDDMQMALFGYTGIHLPPEDKYLNKLGKDGLKNGKLGEQDLTYIHYSTSKEALDWLAESHPELELVAQLQEYNKLSKLLSTYTQGLLDMADSKDVLHGNLKATGTATSRLASSNPNLQNIPREVNDPRRFDYNYQIKTAMIPNKELGHDTIINVDYSSQEAHLAAIVANDQDMISSFMSGEDVHKATAALMSGVPYDEVTKDQRSAAKKITFG